MKLDKLTLGDQLLLATVAAALGAWLVWLTLDIKAASRCTRECVAKRVFSQDWCARVCR